MRINFSLFCKLSASNYVCYLFSGEYKRSGAGNVHGQFIIYDGLANLEHTNWLVIKTYNRIITLSRNLTAKRYASLRNPIRSLFLALFSPSYFHVLI